MSTACHSVATLEQRQLLSGEVNISMYNDVGVHMAAIHLPSGSQGCVDFLSAPDTGEAFLDPDNPGQVIYGSVGVEGFESFQFAYLDAAGQTLPFTVNVLTIGPGGGMGNAPPVARDDSAPISMVGIPVAQKIFVLGNDFDLDIGDTLKIVSAGPSAINATIWVDTSGLFLWYLAPTFSAIHLTTGGSMTLPFNYQENLDDPGDSPVQGGFEGYQDEFRYFIQDRAGARANAKVIVRGVNAPEWSQKIVTAYDDESEVGVDGSPGFNMTVKQTYAEGAPGNNAKPATQEWQDIWMTTIQMYVNPLGEVKMQKELNKQFAEAAEIDPVPFLQIDIDDELGISPAGNLDHIMIIQHVDRTAGFNTAGGELRLAPAVINPFIPNAAEKRALAKMVNSTMDSTVDYIFVDKAKLLLNYNNGTVSQDQYNLAVQLLTTAGLNIDTMPNQYEQLKIGAKGVLLKDFNFLSP